MTKFRFEVVNTDNKKISGEISADSEVEAREKLKQRQLAILSLSIANATETETNTNGMQKFEFQGVGEDKKISQGFISALDSYAAYKELKQKYNFDIKYLYPANLSDNEKNLAKKNGVPNEIIELYKEEFPEKTAFFGLKKSTKKEKKNILSASQQKELEEFREKINNLISEVTALLQQNDNILNASKKREIQERLNLLARLQRSNALDHLKSISQKIIDEISEDTLFLGNDMLSSEQLQKLQSTKTQFKNFSTKLNASFTESLSKIELNLGTTNINSDKIIKNLRKFNIWTEIGKVLYSSALCLLGIMTTFWSINALKGATNSSLLNNIMFYFESTQLWFITFVCIIIVLTYLPVIVNKNPLTFKAKSLYFLTCCFLIFAIALELPVLLTWIQ